MPCHRNKTFQEEKESIMSNATLLSKVSNLCSGVRRPGANAGPVACWLGELEQS